MSDVARNIVELNLMKDEQGIIDVTKQQHESFIFCQPQSCATNKKLEDGDLDTEHLLVTHHMEPVVEKAKENEIVEKLKAFFDRLQKQHPESHLELQYVENAWKVWCGVCKKFLRPDKSGKALHNIEKQHFSSLRHKKNLHLLLHGEEVTENDQGMEKKVKH